MLRKPPEHLNPNKALDAIQESTWTTLECQLVTPMYGGGVVSHTVDEKMPIRVSSIRGQLRFWWRLLATHLWRLGNVDAIRQAEADLWGGIDDKTKASKVFLRVDNIKSLQIEAWATYEINSRTGRYQSLPSPKNWANVPYVLFPAQGKRPDVNDAETPHALAKIGLEWNLIIGFVENLQPDPKKPEYNPNMNQTIKALTEAEAYHGPSIVIAYAPCEMHSIKGGMTNCQNEMKKAVEAGYWNLFTFNPANKAQGKNPFTLTSKAVDNEKYQALLANETRYSRLTRAFPDRAKELFARNQEVANDRYEHLTRLVELYK